MGGTLNRDSQPSFVFSSDLENGTGRGNSLTNLFRRVPPTKQLPAQDFTSTR